MPPHSFTHCQPIPVPISKNWTSPCLLIPVVGGSVHHFTTPTASVTVFFCFLLAARPPLPTSYWLLDFSHLGLYLCPCSKCHSLHPEDGGSKFPLKCWYPAATLYGITNQKTSTGIFTAVKTSNLALCKFVLIFFL